MIRHNRLLVTFYIVSDALLGVSAFIIAYALRFYTGLIPIRYGLPPLLYAQLLEARWEELTALPGG